MGYKLRRTQMMQHSEGVHVGQVSGLLAACTVPIPDFIYESIFSMLQYHCSQELDVLSLPQTGLPAHAATEPERPLRGSEMPGLSSIPSDIVLLSRCVQTGLLAAAMMEHARGKGLPPESIDALSALSAAGLSGRFSGPGPNITMAMHGA